MARWGVEEGWAWCPGEERGRGRCVTSEEVRLDRPVSELADCGRRPIPNGRHFETSYSGSVPSPLVSLRPENARAALAWLPCSAEEGAFATDVGGVERRDLLRAKT